MAANWRKKTRQQQHTRHSAPFDCRRRAKKLDGGAASYALRDFGIVLDWPESLTSELYPETSSLSQDFGPKKVVLLSLSSLSFLVAAPRLCLCLRLPLRPRPPPSSSRFCRSCLCAATVPPQRKVSIVLSLLSSSCLHRLIATVFCGVVLSPSPTPRPRPCCPRASKVGTYVNSSQLKSMKSTQLHSTKSTQLNSTQPNSTQLNSSPWSEPNATQPNPTRNPTQRNPTQPNPSRQ